MTSDVNIGYVLGKIVHFDRV